MGRHYPSPRCFKVNRNYSIPEAAKCCGKAEQTIRKWLDRGLRPLDDSYRPLVAGDEFVRFLSVQQKAGKQPCRPEELYCLKCRKPQRPLGNMADYQPLTPALGNLSALCAVCERPTNKRIALADLAALQKILDIHERLPLQHLMDRSEASLNCNLKGEKK